MSWSGRVRRGVVTHISEEVWAAAAPGGLNAEYELPVYQVGLDWLPLPCVALIWPSQLSCLGSSAVGRASAS